MPSIFDRDFDRYAESWQCPTCHHAFSLTWNPNTLSMEPSRPLDPIVIEHACPKCIERLAKSGLDIAAARRGAVRGVSA